MSTTSKAKTGVNNLGFRGYLITLCMFLLFMLDAALTADLLNISVAAIAERTGWDSALMLTISTIAGWVAIFASFFAGSLLKKLGARKLMALSILVFSICAFLVGGVNSFVLYAILTILISVLNNIQLGICMNTVVANWFPHKKGIVMGWATLGMSFSTVAFLPLFTMMTQNLGIVDAYRITGVISLAIGVLCFCVVRDLPEECGHVPDNDRTVSRESLETEAQEIRSYIEASPWNVKKLLKTKQVWQISIMTGIGMMISTGVLSQFIPRFLSMGGTLQQATLIMSVGGVVAIPFSYIWGLVDAKSGGPKKLTTFLLFLYAVGLVLLLVAGANFIACFIALVIFMAALSGINNMFVSYTTSVFGRFDFANANRLMFPIYMGVRAFAFMIVGLGSALFGGYSGVYVLFLILCVVAIIISIFAKTDCIGRTNTEES